VIALYGPSIHVKHHPPTMGGCFRADISSSRLLLVTRDFGWPIEETKIRFLTIEETTMRFLTIAMVLGLCLLTHTACGPDKEDSEESTSEKPDSGAEGDSQGEPNFGATAPLLDTCYKGDTWTCMVEAALVKETNLLRNKPLVQDFESSYVARQWSASQAESGALSHEGFPDQRRELLTEAFPGQSWTFYAENVAMTQASNPDANAIAKQFVTMWRNSEGHRRNMMGNYRYVGVGVARVGNSFYATQIFH